MLCVACVSDWKGIYGSDAAAQKAAANEIRAMRAVIDARIPGLRTAMSRLVHVGIHVVLATVIAPIDASTLTYGSADAGSTICTRDDSRPRELAAAFHLAQHTVQDAQGTRHELWTAADVEFHDDSDSKKHGSYVCDLARLLPPTRNTQSTHTQLEAYVVHGSACMMVVLCAPLTCVCRVVCQDGTHVHEHVHMAGTTQHTSHTAHQSSDARCAQENRGVKG